MSVPYRTSPGVRYPPGSRADAGGVNFSVYSRHAKAIDLLLFERADSSRPFQVIRLDPETNRTYFAWHVYVEGLAPGVFYAWRADGPNDTTRSGFRFNPHKDLADPWARAVTAARWDRRRACDPSDDGHHGIRAVVLPPDDYDWEGDAPLNHALQDSVIYELHVGGFTRHPSSGVSRPGTFAGLIEKIPYLSSLGVTDVELMPVMAFDESDVPPGGAGRGLRNYWGYSTHGFYAPHPGYCVAPLAGTQVDEFRDLVKSLHRAGIGVILDVVLNHTSEGGADGPWIHFKGLSNPTFYHLDPLDRRRYVDYTGCGNTVNCNHPVVADFLADCLKYWVREMHVDGFRFDLASVLARGEGGTPSVNAPVVWAIELSDTLAHTRLIAEAWDAGGLYQVGAFPGMRWAEWNGLYRDALRRFVRGDPGMAGEVATRLAGSSDLYARNGRLPVNSVNFVTCHDGFTLWDLVSHERKHNEANGEDNRDGMDENLSSNAGTEGPTDDPRALELRRRRSRDFIALLMLSQGVPMLLAGDEVLRTQRGNNNAYCQDNDVSWFDWNLVDRHSDMLRFVRGMIALRRRHPSLRRGRFLTGKPVGSGDRPDVRWHGERLDGPPWLDADSAVLAFTLAGLDADEPDLHVMINMTAETRSAEVPALPGQRWCRAVDTSLPSPADVLEPAEQPPLDGDACPVPAWSVVVLEARPTSEAFGGLSRS